MSTLKARKRARVRVSVPVPAMRPIKDQLQMMRGALIAKAQQPDTSANRATLKALALATAFVIDGCEIA